MPRPRTRARPCVGALRSAFGLRRVSMIVRCPDAGLPVATIAPESRSTACSALCAKCVRPSFILVIFASGRRALPFLVRALLLAAPIQPRQGCRVGVRIPAALASRVRYCSYASPVSRRTMLRIAAFASSVVPSTTTVLPFTNPCFRQTLENPAKHLWCVSTSIKRRVREIVECQGLARPAAQKTRTQGSQPPGHPPLRSNPSKYPTASSESTARRQTRRPT